MIEQILIQYLNSVLDVPVYTETPKAPPVSYCLIERVGGGEEEHISTAEVVVQSYDSTLNKAALLNKAAKNAMLDAVVLPQISSVVLNSSYNYTENTQYRYQSLFDINYYEED